MTGVQTCVLPISFEHQAATIAGALLNRHRLEAGDRVAIVMDNCLEFLPALYGIWRAGLCAVPVNAKLHPKEVAWIIDDSGAKLVLATADVAAKMSGLAGQVWPQTIIAGTRDWMSMLFADPVVHAPPIRAKKPGSSIPAVRRGGPRAQYLRIAICFLPLTPTTPTSTLSITTIACCMRHR